MDWTPYLHPAAMLCVLGLGAWVLREGLRLRRARLAGRTGRTRTETRAHTRIARPFVLLILVGYASGLSSMWWLRPEEPMESVHFWLASAATLGFTAAGALGLWLERHASADARAVHLACGGAGLLLALGAVFAAFAILP